MTRRARNSIFGLMDIPMSCSLFLEPALNHYQNHLVPLSPDITKFIHEWNRALISVMSRPEFMRYLGVAGNKILRGAMHSHKFLKYCVEWADDVQMQSLHYALRFSDGVNYLAEKRANGAKINMVDLGCGFSPMAVIPYGGRATRAYCIDRPEIIEVYDYTCSEMGIPTPGAISWHRAVSMAQESRLNTIVAIGVFPYMALPEQVARLKSINKWFPNFLVEIKYNNDSQTTRENVFDLKKLIDLRMSAKNAHTLESQMIQNSMRYLHRFMCAMPNRRYFIAGERSLFLSR